VKNEKRPVGRCGPFDLRARQGGFEAGMIHHRSNARCYPSCRSVSSPVGACASAGDCLCQRTHLEPPVSRLPDAAEPTSWVARAGCPARPPQLADVVAPVAWFSSPATGVPFPGCPVRGPADRRIIPWPTPLPSREPGWTRSFVPAITGDSVRSKPFLGFRLACAGRCERESARLINAGQAVFFKSQGYPPNNAMIPRSILVIHCASTTLCTSGRWPRR
jgi:hypothetical protein